MFLPIEVGGQETMNILNIDYETYDQIDKAKKDK